METANKNLTNAEKNVGTRRLKDSIIVTLIWVILFSTIFMLWILPDAPITIKLVTFLIGTMGFFVSAYFLFKHPSEVKDSNIHKHTKNAMFFALLIIAVLAGLFAYEFGLCMQQYDSLIGDLKTDYKYCNSDEDCKQIGSGDCVNLEGYERYENLKKFCIEPLWKCIIPDECACKNHTCKEVYRNANITEE